MSNPTTPKEGQDELDEILAEYQIGFVVGDKDVNEHISKFKQALNTLIAKEIARAQEQKRLEMNMALSKGIQTVEENTIVIHMDKDLAIQILGELELNQLLKGE